MRIAVIGDTHFGFDHLGVRHEDAYVNAKEAFEIAISEKVDFILQTGDVFHERLPKPEVISPVIKLMKEVSKKIGTVKLIRSVKNSGEKMTSETIPPIILIYGDHDRRPKEYVNPVQLLQDAGAVYCLEKESLILEFNKKRIGIHGFSNVPHQYAKDILNESMPKSFSQMKNLFVIHQSFQELLPNQAPEIMNYSDLPKNMDLHILGHIHWRQEAEHPLSKSKIILPGSTVLTQMRRIESKISKGVYILEIGEKIFTKFIELKKPRKLYYETIDISKKKPSEILTMLQERIKKTLDYHTHPLTPMIRYSLKGELHDGFIPSDLSFRSLNKKYQGKAIINIGKTKIESKRLGEKSKLIEDLKSQKISIESLGLKILAKKLSIKNNEKLSDLFEALSDSDLERAESLL